MGSLNAMPETVQISVPTLDELAEFRLSNTEWDRSQARTAHARAIKVSVDLSIATSSECIIASTRLLTRVSYATRPQDDDISSFPEVRAAERAIEAGAAHGSPRTFAAVTQLIAQVERSVANDIDLVDRLIADLKHALASDADPALLLGLLLEGIVQTVVQRMQLSITERRDAVIALCTVLVDRISPGAD